MLIKIDYFFTYKNILRYVLINKIGYITNIYNIPKINKLKFLFYFTKLEDYDDTRIYNSIYLLKFFLGRKIILNKTKSFFLLGKWYYNFNVSLIINSSKYLFNLYYYFNNNIISNINESLINKGFNKKFLNIFFLLFKEMNAFSEIKNNLGLFNLKTNININLYLLGLNNKWNNIFINILKIYL